MNTCDDCGRILKTSNSKRCRSCAAVVRIKNRIEPPFSRYIDGRTKKLYYCIKCNSKISITSALYGSHKCNKCVLKGKPLSDKHKKLVCINLKNGEANKGSKNSQWKGGLSFEVYPLSFSKKLKEEIRKRDQYTCQICGKNEQEEYRNFCIHHIDYNKKNSNKDNLITLCDSCHQKTNFNRNTWVKYFKELLYVTN